MTENEYLQSILKEQTLPTDGAEIKSLQSHREKVERLLLDKFSECNPTIRYGGSYAKKTMIRELYDLDIICYFPCDSDGAGETLEEIYNNVAESLNDEYIVDRKTSALRLRGMGDTENRVDFHIDVVPGRFTDANATDAYIYQHAAEKGRLKTNIDKHLSFIRDSGLTDAIRLVKLWNVRKGLRIKTFVLELMVIKVLSESKKSALDKQLSTFMEVLVESEGKISVEDPANPAGNDLSSHIDSFKQSMLVDEAKRAIDCVELGGWEAVFGQLITTDKSSAIGKAVLSSAGRTKPWASL